MQRIEDKNLLEALRADRLIKSGPTILDRNRVRKYIGTVIRNNRLQLLRKSIRNTRYLNAGCGSNLVRGFINLDYGWRRGLDLCWDLRKGIPLRSNSLSGIFTEHVLEHFEWRDIEKTLLPEFFRVLHPGGVMRVCVPDAEMAIDCYLLAKQQGLLDQPFRDPNPNAFTPLMHVTNTFRRLHESYAVGHKFAWDFQTMEFFLAKTGFIEIERVSYMQGRDASLLVDYVRRAKESLYVEAMKPKAGK